MTRQRHEQVPRGSGNKGNCCPGRGKKGTAASRKSYVPTDSNLTGRVKEQLQPYLKLECFITWLQADG